MFLHKRAIKTLKLLLISTLIFSQICIAARPPGVPKKKDCNNAITAVELQRIDFGSFLAGTGGKVLVSTSGTRTSTGGVILLGGIPSAGIFEVNSTLAGCDYYPLKIKARRSTLTETGGATMVIKGIKTVPLSGVTLVPGTPLTIQLSGKVIVGATQTPGTYNATPGYSLVLKHLKP